MEKNKGYPFYRNRYYSGKLLCSSDFISEQQYFNHKRHFLTHLTHGYGVLCGLNVTAADTLSLLVESGAALDILGREIVLEKDMIKRISVIDGFDETETEQLVLCISYQETPERPVHVPVKEDAERDVECNSIREGCSLFLLDRRQALRNPQLIHSILGETVLFENEDFKISFKMPVILSRKCPVLASVVLEKLSHEQKQLKFQCLVQTPGLLTDGGEREFAVELETCDLEKGRQSTLIVSLSVEDSRAAFATLLVKAESLSVVIDEIAVSGRTDIMIQAAVSSRGPEEIIRDFQASFNLEKYFEKTTPDYIQLADIDVSRTRDTCVIERVSRPSCLRIVHTAAGDAMIREAMACYGKKENGKEYAKSVLFSPASEPRQSTEAAENLINSRQGAVSSGTCEIPLGKDGKSGAVFFSDEIMHKLGRGDTCVQVGYEFVENDSVKGIFSQKTIYGDMDIFERVSSRIPRFRSAVMVNSYTGTFTVGIKLLESTDAVLVSMRWFAFRGPDFDQSLLSGEGGNRQIIAVPSTMVLQPGESVFIGAVFRNMEPVSYRYDLLEREAGEITSEGIYTAPAREGVFEILITCIDYPDIATYAYAVVKRGQTRDDSD